MTDLIVFCDGARGPEDADGVAQVRDLARAVEGFASVSVVEQVTNLGLLDVRFTGGGRSAAAVASTPASAGSSARSAPAPACPSAPNCCSTPQRKRPCGWTWTSCRSSSRHRRRSMYVRILMVHSLRYRMGSIWSMTNVYPSTRSACAPRAISRRGCTAWRPAPGTAAWRGSCRGCETTRRDRRSESWGRNSRRRGTCPVHPAFAVTGQCRWRFSPS